MFSLPYSQSNGLLPFADWSDHKVWEETEVKKEEKTGMNVKGLGAIVLAAILGVAGIAVYKKHGRGKEDDYVSEQLEFSDGPYVNEEEDEEEQ